MKGNWFKLLALVPVFCYFSANAQTPVIPSDTAALPYVVSDVVNSIKNYVETPSAQNQYASFILNEPGFPAVTLGQSMPVATETQVANWVKTHQASVEQFLIARKQNFDQFGN